MNHAFTSAAALAVATGLAHTVIGEILIFRRMRRGTFIPTFGGDVLHERHVRILWASWHALTLLAWAMAAMLVVIASAPASEMALAITRLISIAMGSGSLAVLVGTRARHPGWMAMLVVAVLIEFGR